MFLPKPAKPEDESVPELEFVFLIDQNLVPGGVGAGTVSVTPQV